MDISRERRRDIINALRKGTVPQRGLDFLAVGLGRFEPVVAGELADVAGGGSAFKAVRGDYGCGKTFFGRWVQEIAKRKGFAVAEVQISETETPLHRLETVYRRAMEGLVHRRLLPRGLPLGARRLVLRPGGGCPGRGRDRCRRRGGPGPTIRRAAGTAARGDHPSHAPVRRRPAGVPVGPASGRPRHRRGAGRAGSPGSRMSPPRSSGSPGSRGTWTTSPP